MSQTPNTNLVKSAAAWKRLQTRASGRTFANRTDAVYRSGITRKSQTESK